MKFKITTFKTDATGQTEYILNHCEDSELNETLESIRKGGFITIVIEPVKEVEQMPKEIFVCTYSHKQPFVYFDSASAAMDAQSVQTFKYVLI